MLECEGIDSSVSRFGQEVTVEGIRGGWSMLYIDVSKSFFGQIVNGVSTVMLILYPYILIAITI